MRDGISDVAAPAEYKDRRTGLIAFGILEILAGFLCMLVMIVLLFLVRITPELSEALNRQTIGLSLAFYGLATVALVWLGIGSLLCKRWARVLLLIGSWSLLLGGIISIAFFILFARDIYPATMPDSIALFSMVFTLLILAIFAIALPLTMVLFYGSSNVKATCMARDPHTRWTDTCPLPVLATSLWLGLSSLSVLIIPVIYRSVLPCFGILIRGTPATLMLMVGMALGFYLTWATYRLKMSAWWIMLLVSTLACLSSAITFLKVDLLEFYHQLGYAEQQIEQLRKFKYFSSPITVGWIVVCYIVFVIYWIGIKKFFHSSDAKDPQSALDLPNNL
jgi:hypothetical protein